MRQEIDLTPEQILLLIPLILWIAWTIWRFESHSKPDFKPKAETNTDKLNPHYGAYIQLASKRYN
ncbi:hypothetical protein OJ597_05780 [Streptococcus anginosus]|uniref:Phage membrane protein n=1 Tax=Streptococcus anginosus TaxID=1328 RepID=A0ABT3E950_STRAP|nr:hypothetical protein [Streptococcus anginosus]